MAAILNLQKSSPPVAKSEHISYSRRVQSHNISAKLHEATAKAPTILKGNTSHTFKPTKTRPPFAAAATKRTNQLAGGSRAVVQQSTAKGTQKMSDSKTAFSSRLSQQSTIAAHPRSHRHAFETDPVATSKLWSRVMAPTAPTRASRGKARGRYQAGSQAGSRPSSWKDTGLGGSQLTDLTDESQSACRPGMHDFESSVLKPRGIIILRGEVFLTPFGHFGMDEPAPKSGAIAPYHKRDDLKESTIWLDDDDDAFVKSVRQEYLNKRLRGRPEAEFSITGLTKLLRAEPMNLEWPKSRCFLPERYLQAVLKPKERLWLEPPITNTNLSSRRYNFDIHPDCTYWISLRAFSPKYYNDFTSVVHIYNHLELILCPYLTVEFKKDAAEIIKAEHQVAAAGSLALYNRWSLRKRRLSKTNEGFEEACWKNIRHYGLTFSGPQWSIWYLKSDICYENGEWRGCRMVMISDGSCSENEESVRCLIHWLNEIHAWGLGRHGPEVEKDVKIILANTPGASRTSLSEEELQRFSKMTA